MPWLRLPYHLSPFSVLYLRVLLRLLLLLTMMMLLLLLVLGLWMMKLGFVLLASLTVQVSWVRLIGHASSALDQ
jgi:hypothetical protein